MKNQSTVLIYTDGKLYGSYLADQDGVIDVDGKMQVSFRSGKVFVSGTTCPDKLCQKQGALSALPIVCAPHSIVICYSDPIGFDGVVR